MATAGEIRKWAKEHGYDMPERGNIPGDIRSAYDAANPGGNGAAPPPDENDFEKYFGSDEAFDESAMDGAEQDTGETPPRKPRPSRARTTPRGRFGFGKAKDTKGAKKKPRVSVEDLLGSLWRGAAKLAAPLPPLQRTLRVQAPVAGLLLEDAVRDTAVDVMLQPLARFANQGKVVSALLGPPVIVTALTVHQMQRAAEGGEPNQVFMAVGLEALRSSLMTWMDVAGPKFEQAVAREKEFEGKYGRSVDEFIAMLFAAPPATAAEAQAEEDAIRRAQGILADV